MTNANLDSIVLTLFLEADSDIDVAEQQELTRRLYDILLDADALSVEFATTPRQVVSGTKGGTAVDLTTLLVSVGAAALPSLILLIQSWLLRQQNQSLRVKIGEVEMEIPRNANQSEIDRLVKAVRQIPQPAKQK